MHDYSTLPREILQLILQPFQRNEQSFLVSIVCKKWNSIVRIDRNCRNSIEYYAEHRNFSALKWIK